MRADFFSLRKLREKIKKTIYKIVLENSIQLLTLVWQYVLQVY